MSDPAITVIAGVNGAGKSAVVGNAIRYYTGEFTNPDEITRAYLVEGLSLPDANERAWNRMRDELARAIADQAPYAFESTLGGNTITQMLLEAGSVGLSIDMFYVGLASLDMHLARVAARVARGGHDIPEDHIRQRWYNSRRNLVRLLPVLRTLKLFDNSTGADPAQGLTPDPVLILHMRAGRIHSVVSAELVPVWAKPIVEAALKAP